MLKKIARYGIDVLILLLIMAQFLQPDQTNPPADPSASFEAVARPPKELAGVVERACRDCHSNRTVWPGYSKLAPVSWLVASDVKEGRAKLNFSQWNIYSAEMTKIKLREICRETIRLEMPPWYYLPMHPDAKLSGRDVAVLCSSGM